MPTNNLCKIRIAAVGEETATTYLNVIARFEGMPEREEFDERDVVMDVYMAELENMSRTEWLDAIEWIKRWQTWAEGCGLSFEIELGVKEYMDEAGVSLSSR